MNGVKSQRFQQILIAIGLKVPSPGLSRITARPGHFTEQSSSVVGPIGDDDSAILWESMQDLFKPELSKQVDVASALATGITAIEKNMDGGQCSDDFAYIALLKSYCWVLQVLKLAAPICWWPKVAVKNLVGPIAEEVMRLDDVIRTAWVKCKSRR